MSACSGERRKVADGAWEGAPRGGVGVARVPPLLAVARGWRGAAAGRPRRAWDGLSPGLGPEGLGCVLQVLFSLPLRCSAIVGFTVRVNIPPSTSLSFSWLSSPNDAVPPVPLKPFPPHPPERAAVGARRPLSPAAGLRCLCARFPRGAAGVLRGPPRRCAAPDPPGRACALRGASPRPRAVPPLPRARVCVGERAVV